MQVEKLQKDGPENIVYAGKIFEVVKQSMRAGDKKVVFEIVRRSPGVRLIIVREDKMLIIREFRAELDGYDYRLPGGKVFDTLEEYKQNLSKDILSLAFDAAKRECAQEVGLIANKVKHYITTKAGATVLWDLIYCIIDDFEVSRDGQNLEIGEFITAEWKTFAEVKELCKNGSIKEDRTLGVLFKFFLQYPEKYVH